MGRLVLKSHHRLMCGSSSNAANVATLFAGGIPFIMVTDPPYGVNYDPTFRSNNRTGVVENDHTASWIEAYRLFPGPVAYVWHGGLHVVTVASELQEVGFDLRAMIIWVKPTLVMGRGHYHWRHEGALYAARGTAKWCGDRTQSTIWEIDHVHPTHGTTDDGQTEHGCQKPVECMARPIRNHGGPTDDVYDPFVGSGTTIIAAQQVGRRCYAMELSPAYVDVAATRWERFATGNAILEATGETLAQVRERRAAERQAQGADPAATAEAEETHVSNAEPATPSPEGQNVVDESSLDSENAPQAATSTGSRRGRRGRQRTKA